MFLELLTLIVTVPLFLFLTTLYPLTSVVFFGLWLCCLCFDVYSTHQFYREAPDKFGENEQNKLFCWFVRKVNFKRAIILFPVMVEVPLLVFFAMLPLQLLHNYLFSLTPNSLMAGLFEGFGIAAIGHLQAAIKNTYINHHYQSAIKQTKKGEPQF